MRKRKFLRALLWLALACTVLAGTARGQTPTIHLLDIKGPVTPIMQSYIDRGIQASVESGAVCLIVQLDTLGGSVNVTGEVVKEIQNADIPVVIYIAPAGATAASAGTLVTLAGHVAAMAPGTTIGALSPVGPQGEELPETAKTKEVEWLVANARNLAARRGESALAWVEKAIRESAVATANEALKLGVVDIVATDLNNLVAQLDGREIQLAYRKVTLRTSGAQINRLPMNLIESFLHVITDPNIAFILMTIGINAVIFELSSPGGYVLGIIGVICLVLAFYAFGVLSVNYTGLAFIALSFVLFALDVITPGLGVLTVGGVVALVLGAMVLFNTSIYPVSRPLIFTVALATGMFFAFVVSKAIRAQSRPVAVGAETLVGQIATARSRLDPQGRVWVEGELWDAIATDGPIAPGEKVKIVGVEGLHLHVQSLTHESPTRAAQN
ncbi:MAG: nodulation protein NfeD [Chloroflexi bacterium]|nr:nodulation protein NfeD [Chloroflexota bacterium]